MIEKLGNKPLEAIQKVEYFFDPPKNRFLRNYQRESPMVYFTGTDLGNTASNMVLH